MNRMPNFYKPHGWDGKKFDKENDNYGCSCGGGKNWYRDNFRIGFDEIQPNAYQDGYCCNEIGCDGHLGGEFGDVYYICPKCKKVDCDYDKCEKCGYSNII